MRRVGGGLLGRPWTRSVSVPPHFLAQTNATATAPWRPRRARSIERRTQGCTYDQIAAALGYANRGTVYRIVRDALIERQDEAVDSLRFLESQRLDALQAALLGQGDVRGREGRSVSLASLWPGSICWACREPSSATSPRYRGPWSCPRARSAAARLVSSFRCARRAPARGPLRPRRGFDRYPDGGLCGHRGRVVRSHTRCTRRPLRVMVAPRPASHVCQPAWAKRSRASSTSAAGSSSNVLYRIPGA
ncbi:hypothetical protein BJ986_002257 [Phycicoccus badiiscoriae]|uniref:Uncharacterized protein n=1 Tax=Pedococcus badiiscoriae TaxID=642776 RepID=A0A852WG54_9MICO|nr:hypothetical protein [Pedococcus badiiscoriae]